MAENYISNEYPYGKFPTQYTKLGQEELRKQWKENKHQSHQDFNEHKNKDFDFDDKNKNKIDIHKILPLIKKMNSNTPLSQGDLMGMLMSLVGKENKDMVDVFSIIANTQTAKEKDIKTLNINANNPKIDSFKKVE